MSLVLEIEYLTGVCVAAEGPESRQPEWPPQPDRAFSALVATWGVCGEEDAAQAQALEWLEKQPAPSIEASAHRPRMAPVSFVPPNDPESGRKGSLTVLPRWRRRQPRRFPATRPDYPVIRMRWSDAEPDDQTLNALQALAANTSYVGHSASLTRCKFDRFDREEMNTASGEPVGARKWVYPGRLAELRRSYQVFVQTNGLRGRPLPGTPVRQETVPGEEFPHAFEDRWLLLEHVGGQMPDLRASAVVAKTLRDTLLSGYRQAGLGDRIPEVISGHTSDGRPTVHPHLAIIPLAFTGYPYADGHMMGFALVPPRDSVILDDPGFRKALRAISPMTDSGQRIVNIRPQRGVRDAATFSIDLSPRFEPPPGRRSLEPERYLGPARTFATVTPIVLDRHLKKKGEARQAEIEAQIAGACRNLGLPEPEAVVPDKHSAIEGTAPAWPSGNAPGWMRWRLPEALRSRQLSHAVIRFPQPVRGPLLLGAGRFVGMGLGLPLDSAQGVPHG
ncbi:MAG TPA: type I-U CRISPR-associated protein Csb2 [Gammaproteobacteria bacterium]|nr:type I-U CRISPR-associated protein Csb2 [Gammaproteobacteria bacterium]